MYMYMYMYIHGSVSVCVSRPLTGAPVSSVRVEEVRVESVRFGELLQVLADVAHLVRERERTASHDTLKTALLHCILHMYEPCPGR